MSIMELGALGEFFSSFGVIATLIYLAVQVRLTNKTASASAFNSLTSLDVTLNSILLADREVCELIVRARAGLGALDEVERFRFGLCASTIFRVADNYYEYDRSGLMTQVQWSERASIIRDNFGNLGLQEYWVENAGSYTRSFQSLVTQILKELDTDAAAVPGTPRS